MLKLIIPALILLLTAAPHAHPGTITVRPDGTGDYPTIQAAINAAANGDEIVCSDGTYSGPGNRDIDFFGKAITVRSESGPENCIIDCGGGGPAFEFSRGEDANSMLDGFTITTSANYPLGMGIFCYGASPTINNCRVTGMQTGMGLQDCNSKITNCIIRDNKGEGNGGIACYSASPTISNCIISGNVAESIPWFRVYGGGIGCVEGSSPTIKDCIISDNSASYGGGIGCLNGSNPVIINCTITGNSGRGGGIYCENSSPAISNCTLSENKAEDGWGVVCRDSVTIIKNCEISGNAGGGVNCWRSNLTIANCTIQGNTSNGIVCDDSTARIDNCIISGNAAGEYNSGGGIHCGTSTMKVTDSTIANNLAEWGGGIYAGGDSATMIANCVVNNNRTEGEYPYGGGIFYGGGNHTISNCEINGNKAKGGGGIDCTTSSPIVTNCTFYGNSAEQYGGAIYCNGGNPEIIRCTIVGNSAVLGGGIHSETSSPTITDCTISDNSARDGGAIYTFYSISLTITNCMISGNSANNGGGIYMRGGNSTVANCIISGNISHKTGMGPHGHGGGIFCWESEPAIVNCTITGNVANKGGGLNGCRGPISNCIIWDNSSDNGPQLYNSTEPNYSCIQGWSNSGEDNIDADPCFVEPGYWDANGVWVEGGYHLLEGSPCIDTGDPNYVGEPNETDLDGNPRILDGDKDGVALVDMGAYEFWPPVEAEMMLTPHALSCASKGRWVKAHIVLPEGYLPEDVDINTPAVAEPMGVESKYIKVIATNPVRLEIAFARAAFCEALTETGEIEVTVYGSLTTGQYFYATDTITIKRPPMIRKSIKQEQTRKLRRNHISIINFEKTEQ